MRLLTPLLFCQSKLKCVCLHLLHKESFAYIGKILIFLVCGWVVVELSVNKYMELCVRDALSILLAFGRESAAQTQYTHG